MQMASGDRISLQTYQFVGANPGKKVYIQANLHGAELAGNAVIHQLIEFLTDLDASKLAGEVLLVPVCNPLGVNQRSHHFSAGRYNPYDGRDWNRIFWDHENEDEDIEAFVRSHLACDPSTIVQNYRQRIQASFQNQLGQLQSPAGAPVHEHYRAQLQSLALEADCLIDLHSSSDRGLTYLYYFRDRSDSAAFFGLDFAILLDEYDGDAFDEAFIKPWLALEAAFADQGRPLRFDIEAFTLELGTGMELNPESVAKGLQGVKHYLYKKGVFVGPENPPANSYPLFFTHRSAVKKYYATAGGMIQARVKPGTWVEVGDRLYQLLSFNKSGQPPQVIEIQAHVAGLVYDVSINHAVNQGEYVLALVQPEGDEEDGEAKEAGEE